MLPAQCAQETLKSLTDVAGRMGVPLCLSSPGQLGLGGMAGEGIPVMNGESAKMLSYLGCESVTLSRELARGEIADLPEGICEYILPVYGRARLMLLNHCPMRACLGLEKGKAQCRLCEEGRGAAGTRLTDRMGAEYPLLPQRLPEGCLVELLDSRPLHLSGRLVGLPPLSWQLNFTDEAPESRLSVTKHYAALLRGEAPPPLGFEGTGGRFSDGVL